MKQLIFWIYIAWQMLFLSEVFAQEYRFEAAWVNFDGRHAPAFRVEIPRPDSAVKAALRAHLLQNNLQPVWRAGWWECREVNYPPIMSEQPVSLAFSVRPHSTQVTLEVIGQDFSGAFLTPEEFPGLSYRLLQDLSLWIQDFSGVTPQYSHLFEDSIDLSKDYAPPAAAEPREKDGIALRSGEDPPAKASQAQLEAYRDTIRILKDGIYSYELLLKEQQEFIDTLLNKLEGKPVKVKRPPVTTVGKADQSQALQDSVANLKELAQTQEMQLVRQKEALDSLRKALEQNTQAARQEVSPAQPVETVIPQPAGEASPWQARMAAAQDIYQREMRTLQERYTALEKNFAQLKRHADEQEVTIARLREDLEASEVALNREKGQANTSLERSGLFNRKLRSELKLTREQLKEAESRVEKGKTNMAALYRELEATKKSSQHWLKEYEQREKEVVRLQEDNRKLLGEKNRRTMDFIELGNEMDSVLQASAALKARNQQLLLRQDSLLAEIELLSPYTESAQARRRVYQQQLENLSQLQQRLPRQEQALNAREKLLQQRERIVKEQDAKAALSEALSLNEQLSRENQYLRQQLAGTDRGAGIVFGELYSAALIRGSEATPAFCVDTRLSDLALRDHIAHYFLERQQQPISKDPLVFQRVRLPGGDLGPVKVTFEIGPALSNGWRQLACLVKKADGKYLDAGEEGARQAVRQLLEEIFP